MASNHINRKRYNQEFFKPIAEVLMSGDRSRLDPLPPEQREFAEDVLKKFKDEDESRQTAV